MSQPPSKPNASGSDPTVAASASGISGARSGDSSGASQDTSGPLTAGQVTALKFAVIAMGLMIVAGLAAVVGRVIYLASGPAKQAGNVTGGANYSASAGSGSSSQRAAALARMTLPAQATVRTLALSGDKLAVHFDGPAGTGIVIVDIHSGAVVSRIDLVPELPHGR